jgi:acetate CoA/acetoacetate CoA-transferase beta subunit
MRRVTLVITDMAVLEPTRDGLVIKEVAPGIKVDQVRAASATELIAPGYVPEMPF